MSTHKEKHKEEVKEEAKRIGVANNDSAATQPHAYRYAIMIIIICVYRVPPWSWEGRSLAMHDANGDLAVTALWPLRLPFLSLVSSQQVFFNEGGMIIFVDMQGLISRGYDDFFLRRRERIVSEFIAYFRKHLPEDVIKQVVLQSEEEILA